MVSLNVVRSQLLTSSWLWSLPYSHPFNETRGLEFTVLSLFCYRHLAGALVVGQIVLQLSYLTIFSSFPCARTSSRVIDWFWYSLTIFFADEDGACQRGCSSSRRRAGVLERLAARISRGVSFHRPTGLQHSLIILSTQDRIRFCLLTRFGHPSLVALSSCKFSSLVWAVLPRYLFRLSLRGVLPSTQTLSLCAKRRMESKYHPSIVRSCSDITVFEVILGRTQIYKIIFSPKNH